MAKQEDIKIEEESQGLKRCSKCGGKKPFKEFYAAKREKDGLQYNCRKCDGESSKKYYEAHLEERREYHKKYREINRDKRRAYSREYSKKYNATHKENGKRYDRDKKREYDRAYRKTEKGKWSNREKSSKRRAKERGSHEIEGVDLKEVLERDNYRCQHCGRKTRPDYRQSHPLFPNVDHIVPISLNGSHTRKNMQCLCHHCNVTKGFSGTGDQLRMFG